MAIDKNEYKPGPEKKERQLARLAEIQTELERMWAIYHNSQTKKVHEHMTKISDIIQTINYVSMRIRQGYNFDKSFEEIEQGFTDIKQKMSN